MGTQLGVAEHKLPYFKNALLKEAMAERIGELKSQIHEAVQRMPNERIPLSFDYVVCAEFRGDAKDAHT
jgi:hypothetical protein